MDKIVQLQLSKPEDFRRWQDFILSRDDTHCTDLGQWRLFYDELYGIRSYTFAYLEDEAVRGGLSVYHIRHPFWAICC